MTYDVVVTDMISAHTLASESYGDLAVALARRDELERSARKYEDVSVFDDEGNTVFDLGDE